MLHVLKACSRSGGDCYELSSLTTYGNIRSSPVISDGTLYFTSGDGNLGNLHAFTASDLGNPLPDRAFGSKVTDRLTARSQPPLLSNLKPDLALKSIPAN